MEKRVNKAVVLITGASGGIGSATAKKFAAAGAMLALHYHSGGKKIEALHASLSGDDHICVNANIGDAESCAKMFDTVIEKFGRIDVLVNNAGVYIEHMQPGLSYSDWQNAWKNTLAVNLTGPANLCFLAAQHMKTTGGGRIINVSSRGAFRGEPDAPAYGASKAGLNALSQSLSLALAKFGISVYAVAPGFVETEMARPFLDSKDGGAIRSQSPFGRVAMPEEIAHTIVFLASPECEFLSGAIIDINGASYLRS